jgi:predicted nuclease of predicted toxin-antitoxin system
MSKRAVIDEDLPRAIDKGLEDLGWEVKDIRDTGLRGKSDKEIIDFAQKNKAVLFSGDWGFANILKFPPRNYYGIVILNFPNEVSTSFIAQETKKAFIKLPLKNLKGYLIIIEPGRIRIRKG